MKKKTSTLTKIALMAALQCIISPFAIAFPFSPVPLSLATLMLYLSVYILGKRDAVISCGIYLLIGLVGIPVFSGFTGGAGKIFGPTGGYLIGYLALVFVSGSFVEKWSGNHLVDYLMQALGMLFGTMVCYFVGSLWLMYQTKIEVDVAVLTGVLPFVLGDIIKLVIGFWTGTAIRKRLVKAGVL